MSRHMGPMEFAFMHSVYRCFGRLLMGLSVLVLSMPTVWAASLDTVEVPIASRSADERQIAFEQGLNEILVRLSGSDSVLASPAAQAASEKLDRWITRYHYQQGAVVVRFDVKGLMALLAEQQAPVWGLPRPRLLVWLVDQNRGHGAMLTAQHPQFSTLQAEAQRRGLSLVLPEWDAQDQQALSTADIRGRFDEPLLAASRRYPHEMIVSGVIYRGANTSVSWRVLRNQKNLEQGRVEQLEIGEALSVLVDDITDRLAARYAVTGSAVATTTVLEVNNVDALAKWKLLQDFFSGLSGMQQVSLLQVSGQTLTYGLDFAASDEQLRSLIDLSRHLTACPDETSLAPQWRYCWQD